MPNHNKLQVVSGPVRPGNGTEDGSGYVIGDNYMLTAGHVVFEWNRDTSNIQFINTSTGVYDYKDYQSYYRGAVEFFLVFSPDDPPPSNPVIEAGIYAVDSVVIRQGGNVDSSDDGLAVFLAPGDLESVTSSVESAASVYRQAIVSGKKEGHILSGSVNADGAFRFSTSAVGGDSGGAYLLRAWGKNYVIGTQSSNVGTSGAAIGSYLTKTDWDHINSHLETSQHGNVTASEPGNLVIGSAGLDVIAGSYRADRILGRGGADTIDDGDAPGDTVWADDTLIGGAGNDTFKAGAGNDTIWGGDENDDQIGGGGTDTVDYNALTAPITISFDGSSAAPTVTVSGATAGSDTLHSIEVIKATEFSDRFEYSGTLPANYQLTVDLAGGVDSQGPFVGLAASDVGMHYDNGEIRNNAGDTSGVIILQNVSTMIEGTQYDDDITDTGDGRHTINAGTGDDTITVDGGDSLVHGGYGDDTINGGSGNDRLFGEDGTDIVNGGGGSDWLENQHYDAALGTRFVDADELDGDEGADYLHATATSADAILSGGAGNDVIDARGSHGVTVRFGAGDGHDTILSDRAAGDDIGPPYDGIGEIDLGTVSKSEVTIVWNPAYLIEDVPPNGNPTDIPGYLLRQGDLVIRIDATGDTILIHDIRGSTTYWSDPAEASQPPFDGPFDFVDLHEITEMVRFADGPITNEDFLGADPLVHLEFGPVDQYATALDEYLAATAAAPGANDGSSGNDDISGSGNDDSISGGGGDDSFRGSGGNDIIDGGAGNDTLRLFGGLADFLVTRDAASGDVILEDKSGLEGTLRIEDVEKIYFASDNADYSPGDLVGFWGTPDNDALVQGNERDNLIYGLAGSDLLQGLAGNDRLDGGAGADVMQGGAGNDVYIVDVAGDVVTESFNGGIDEVQTALAAYALGSNVETLTGLADTGQTLTGNSLANVLTGGGGADVLNGGSGSDTAAWGWSENGVTVDLQNNILSGDAAGDTLISIENLTGGTGIDTLSGTSAANVLDGGAGSDVLTGRGGNDIYYVDDYGDTVVEAAGGGSGDEIRTTLGYYELAGVANVEALRFVGDGSFTGVGGDGNDMLYGGGDGDQLEGGAGVDQLLGGLGDDDLLGGADGDVLDGGAGADYMEGGTGNDVYIVENAGDLVVENAGEGIDQVNTTLAEYGLTDNVENLSGNAYDDQHLTGNDLGNVILGNNNNDTLEGAGGNDELRGNYGNDVLNGGDGDDLLVGGDGIDLMTGGAGADTFRFTGWDSGTLGTWDTITDFSSGEDKIDLSQVDGQFWTAGRQPFTFIGDTAFSNSAGELRYAFDGADTHIQGDWDGDGVADIEIVLAGQVALVGADLML